MPADRSPADHAAGRGQRIGYLNPWRQAAENQAFFSLATAAGRLGHTLVSVANSDEILAADLDFVIVVDPGEAKTTDVPTFGGIHSPRPILFERPEHLHNLLSYDGHLTIADSLERFLAALCVGAGRPARIGRFFHHTAQRQSLHCNVGRLASEGRLRLCYFGRNWEPRARPLFRALAKRPYMRFYGPPQAWRHLPGAPYHGAMPFDGRSVQATYATFGAGLDVLSRYHSLDDVVSSRIFEIVSVGAIAICPDIPWIRRHFGDTVHYYDALGDVERAIAQIDEAFAAIGRDPAGAAERAAAARAVFERDFAAEVMLQNAVDYFAAWQRGVGRPCDPAQGPPVDVVIRVAGHSPAELEGALRSVDNQTRGRFRVILVRDGNSDLSAMLGGRWARITGFEVVDRSGAERSTMLAAGLAAVRSPFFAVLDPDSRWFRGHIAGLLAAAATAAPQRAFAYAQSVIVGPPVALDPAVERDPNKSEGAYCERRRLGGSVPATADLRAGLATLPISSFLAASDLLWRIGYPDPTPDSIAEALLPSQLATGADIRSSFRATLCEPARAERNERPAARSTVLFGDAPDLWPRLVRQLQQVMEAKTFAVAGADRLVLEGNSVVRSLHCRSDLNRREIALEPGRVWFEGASGFGTQAGEPVLAIRPPAQPWSFGATVALDRGMLFAGPQWVVLEFGPIAEMIGAGLLDATGREFHSRLPIPASSLPVELWLEVYDPGDVSAIVVHNWTWATQEPAHLRKAWVVEEAAAGVFESAA